MSTLPNAQALSEWFSAVNGLIIGCGEASALVVEHIINGQPISTSELTQLIKSAIANKQTVGSNNAQTAQNVSWDLQQSGIQSHIDYSPGNALQSIIDKALTAGKPVILGLSNGSALSGETPGLRGHFVTIVGKQGSDYVTADPNTNAATTGGFTTNTLNQFLSAQPFADIVPTNSVSSGIAQNTTMGTPMFLGLPGPGGIGALFSSWLGINPSNIIQGVGGAIISGIGNLITAPLKAVGITSVGDFFWRMLLIILALILFIAGLHAFIGTHQTDIHIDVSKMAAAAAE